MRLVCGEFNATLTPDDAGSKHRLQQGLNHNQDLLHDLTDGADLVAVNTQFQKPRCRLVTFYGPSGRQAYLDHMNENVFEQFTQHRCHTILLTALDHILVWRKWCSSFPHCKAKQVHKCTSAQVRLAMKKTKVSHCICRGRDRLHTDKNAMLSLLLTLRVNGEVKYSLFANTT